MPDVAELACPAHGLLGAAADPDLRPRRWVRLGSGVVERPQPAVEVALAVPERTHQPDRLVATATAALERNAHEVELVLVTAHAHTELDAAVRELLQGRHLLGQVHRVVQRHEYDRGAHPDPLGPAGDPAERDERVVDAAVRIDRLRSDDDVL